MKVLKPGFAYQLANMLQPEMEGQLLHFAGTNEEEELLEGTTSEEVIKALIHALEIKYAMMPVPLIAEAISHLHKGLNALGGKSAYPDPPQATAPEGPDVVHQPEP